MDVLKVITGYWPFPILIIAVAIYRIYRARFKGFLGEQSIARRFRHLNGNKYFVINNLVLNVNSKTSQIDHLVISDFGVFVVETKNYKGWIMGGEHSEFWTQVIYKRKEKFYNPIRQNRGHITALRYYLQSFTNLEYVSIVVFPDSSTIKVQTDSLVIYNSQLTKIIHGYSDIRLTGAEKEAVFDSITKANISRTYKRSAHIKSIKKRLVERENSIEQAICPQCGGSLVVRNGKFSNFMGCSNFPRCRFTINR